MIKPRPGYWLYCLIMQDWAFRQSVIETERDCDGYMSFHLEMVRLIDYFLLVWSYAAKPLDMDMDDVNYDKLTRHLWNDCKKVKL